MPRLHALELLPDDEGHDAVAADWTVLREAGLPSQLDHRGSTNSPHVTVIAVPEIEADLERRAVELLGPLLPIHGRTSGLVVLGGRRATIARTVDLPDEFVRAVLDLRSATGGHEHPGWLAHLTLARRVDRADVPRALDVLATDPLDLTFTSLRRWDPDASAVRPLCSR